MGKQMVSKRENGAVPNDPADDLVLLVMENGVA